MLAASQAVLSSAGGNVIGQAGCVAAVQPTDVVSSSPRLAALANNGGPTETLEVKAGSPAIDRAGLDCPAADQRGLPRPANACDAGAYQRAVGQVAGVKPSIGKAGTEVTITGRNFYFVRTVKFGSTKVPFRVESPTRIVARAPRKLKGKVTVSVVTPDGAGAVGHFTYEKPAK